MNSPGYAMLSAEAMMLLLSVERQAPSIHPSSCCSMGTHLLNILTINSRGGSAGEGPPREHDFSLALALNLHCLAPALSPS
jgi:hypothetical protein